MIYGKEWRKKRQTVVTSQRLMILDVEISFSYYDSDFILIYVCELTIFDKKSFYP